MESRSPVYENLKGTLIGLPAAALLTFVAHWLVVPAWILHFVFVIPVHELGHAWAGWLAGFPALPIGAIYPIVPFTFVGAELWIAIYLALGAGLAFVAYRSVRAHTPFSFCVAIAALFVQYQMTWVISEEKARMIFSWGGLAGELILGTGLIAASYYRLPIRRLRWDRLRYVALLVGTYTVISSLILWRNVRNGKSPLPTGTTYGGHGDTSGDLDRLLEQFQWSAGEITTHYNRLGDFCIGVILVFYGYCVLRAWRKSRD